MYCMSCGKQIEDDCSFCPMCGAIVTAKKGNRSNISDGKVPKEGSKKPTIIALLTTIVFVLFIFFIINNQKEKWGLSNELENVTDSLSEKQNSGVYDEENIRIKISEETNNQDNYEEKAESAYCPDCEESEYNTIGNTQANIQNGGFVATQGKWMYYVYTGGEWGSNSENYIYKEPLEGGTRELLFTSPSRIRCLNVVGDYIFFYNEGTIKRIRCDGEYCYDYEINASTFYVWNNNIYYVKENALSASESVYSLNEYCTDTKVEKEIVRDIEPSFFAVEDTGDSIVVYYGEDFRDVVSDRETPYYNLKYVETTKDNIYEEISSGGYGFFYTGSLYSVIDAKDKYVKNKCLYIGNVIWNLEPGGTVYVKDGWRIDKVYFKDVIPLWEGTINFTEQVVVAQGEQPENFEGLFYCTKDEYMNEEYHVINSDIARYIHIAGDWIYYEEKDSSGIFRVKIDGTNFEKL